MIITVKDYTNRFLRVEKQHFMGQWQNSKNFSQHSLSKVKKQNKTQAKNPKCNSWSYEALERLRKKSFITLRY